LLRVILISVTLLSVIQFQSASKRSAEF